METAVTRSLASEAADRLWRAYAPYQRGRSTDSDLTAMLTILLLAGFIDSVNEPGEELSKRWHRALAEAHTGYPPLRDLAEVLRLATAHEQFPTRVPLDLDQVFRDDRETPDGALPWVTGFLAALPLLPATTQVKFGEVGSLLLERYVAENAPRTGEFFTPRSVTRLLVESLAPEPGDRVLDPACGTGGFLVAAAEHLAGEGLAGSTSFEGHAMDHRNTRLAMLNLVLHGVERPVVSSSDPGAMLRDLGAGMADLVMCNPPFNQRLQGLDFGHWPFGPPPESSANFAWLQLAWSRLSEKGRAALIMPSGAASRLGREARIRREMLAGNALLAVVALPSRLFSETDVPVHLWLLARDKSRQLPAAGADSVLFIDASRLGRQPRRQRHELGPADLERISGRFQSWLRSPGETPDEPGFSCSVPHRTILENVGCSLDPRLYVEPAREPAPSTVSTRELLDELSARSASTTGATTRLHHSFDLSERAARSEAGAPRVRLAEILEAGAQNVGEEENRPTDRLLAGPSGSLIRAEQYVEEWGVPVVMPKDLTGDGFSTADIRCITEAQAAELSRFRLRLGDVVLARRGELGRSAVVREEQVGWVCGTGCFVVRPAGPLDPDYLAAYLRGPEARSWLDAHSTGSTKMKTIPLRTFAELPVVLPDLATQRAIVDTTAQLDEHERLLEEQLTLTRRIRHDALAGGIIPRP
ncbi:N-6 DNA methylase [Streptomyces albidoflavus]